MERSEGRTALGSVFPLERGGNTPCSRVSGPNDSRGATQGQRLRSFVEGIAWVLDAGVMADAK